METWGTIYDVVKEGEQPIEEQDMIAQEAKYLTLE